MSVMMGKQD